MKKRPGKTKLKENKSAIVLIKLLKEENKEGKVENFKNTYEKSSPKSLNVIDLKSILVTAASLENAEDRLQIVKYIIENNEKYLLGSSIKKEEITALTKAVQYNDYKLVEYLLSKGATFDNFVDLQEEVNSFVKPTVCQYAIEKGYFKIAKLLLDSVKTGTELENIISRHTIKFCSLLGVKEEVNSLDLIKILIEKGKSHIKDYEQDAYYKKSFNPIMNAINSWNLELVKFYVDHGVNVKGKPLINCLYSFYSRNDQYAELASEAKKNDAIEILKLLIEKGATIESDIKDSNNFIFAETRYYNEEKKIYNENKKSLLRELLKHEHIKNILIKDISLIRVIVNNQDILEILVEAGSNVNKVDDQKISGKDHEFVPIWIATHFCDIKMFKYLIDKGADWKKINSKGGNILHCAFDSNLKNVNFFGNFKYILDEILKCDKSFISSFFTNTKEYGTPLDNAIKYCIDNKNGISYLHHFLSWILKNNDKIDLDLYANYFNSKESVIDKLLALKIDSVTKLLSKYEKYKEYVYKFEQKTLTEKERLEKKALEEKQEKLAKNFKDLFINKFNSVLDKELNEDNKETIKKVFSFGLEKLGIEITTDLAIKAEKWEHLKILLQCYLGDKINEDEATLFDCVLKTNNDKLINDFAKHYGVDKVDASGYSLLAYAALLGDVKSVKILLVKTTKLSLKFNGKTLNEIAAKNKDINEDFQKIFNLLNPGFDNKPSEKSTESSSFEGIIKISRNKPKNKEAKKLKQEAFETIYNDAKKYDIEELFTSNGIKTEKEKEQYYNFAKERMKLEQKNNNNIEDVTYSWFVDGKCYDSKGTTFHEGYYMIIDCKEKIDDKFYTALSKGFATQSLDDSGIKLVNTIMEIKIINCGDRIYAKKHYINEEGKKLVIFNEIGSHNALDRITVKQGTFKYKKVPSTFTQKPEKILKVSNKSEFGDLLNILNKDKSKDPENLCRPKNVKEYKLPVSKNVQEFNLSEVPLMLENGNISGGTKVNLKTSSENNTNHVTQTIDSPSNTNNDIDSNININSLDVGDIDITVALSGNCTFTNSENI